MRCTIVTLFCLLISFNTIATEKVQKKKKVEIAPVISAPEKAIKPWTPSVFVLDGQTLPKGYEGIEANEFLKLLKSKLDGLKKGEFETSSEFAQRNANSGSLIYPINTTDLYAFQIRDIALKYDADTLSYPLNEYALTCGDVGEFPTLVSCRIGNIYHKADTYIASNAYGASLTVNRIRAKNVALAISKSSVMFSDMLIERKYFKHLYHCKGRIDVSIEKARNLKELTIAALIVGNVNEAKIIDGHITLVEPKIETPNDVMVIEEAIPFNVKKVIYYIVETGEILSQKDF